MTGQSTKSTTKKNSILIKVSLLNLEAGQSEAGQVGVGQGVVVYARVRQGMVRRQAKGRGGKEGQCSASGAGCGGSARQGRVR